MRRKKTRMNEMLVPPLVADPFREHYRALILGSALRAAETETQRHRARGHRRRARRAELTAERLRPLAAPRAPAATTPAHAARAPARRFRAGLGVPVGIAWVAALVLFVVSLLAAGIDSWTTTVTDVALVVLTFAWFWACSEDLEPVGQARPDRPDPSR
jgi:hypothetical protein